MKTTNCKASACRCCGHYQTEGRRGGMCSQLGVPVQGNWKACSLAAPAFIDYKEILDSEIVLLEHSLALTCAPDYLLMRSELEPTSKLEEEAPVR